jgi:hypothetical protein
VGMEFDQQASGRDRSEDESADEGSGTEANQVVLSWTGGGFRGKRVYVRRSQ